MEVDKFVNIERAVQGPFGAETTFTAESRVGCILVHEQAVGATFGTSAGFQMEISGSQLTKIVEIEDDELGKVLNSGQKVQMEHVPGKCCELKWKEVVCGEEASDLQLEGGVRIFLRRR